MLSSDGFGNNAHNPARVFSEWLSSFSLFIKTAIALGKKMFPKGYMRYDHLLVMNLHSLLFPCSHHLPVFSFLVSLVLVNITVLLHVPDGKLVFFLSSSPLDRNRLSSVNILAIYYEMTSTTSS